MLPSLHISAFYSNAAVNGFSENIMGQFSVAVNFTQTASPRCCPDLHLFTGKTAQRVIRLFEDGSEYPNGYVAFCYTYFPRGGQGIKISLEGL